MAKTYFSALVGPGIGSGFGPGFRPESGYWPRPYVSASDGPHLGTSISHAQSKAVPQSGPEGASLFGQYRSDPALEALSQALLRKTTSAQFCRGFRQRPAAMAPKLRPWGEFGARPSRRGYCPSTKRPVDAAIVDVGDADVGDVDPGDVFPEKPPKATYSSSKPQRYHYGDLNPFQRQEIVGDEFGTLTRFDQKSHENNGRKPIVKMAWKRPLKQQEEPWRAHRPW